MLGISFDTFNLIHRWFGRIVVLETVAHALSYIIPNASKETAAAIFTGIFNEPYLAFGFVVGNPGLVSVAVEYLLDLSPSVRWSSSASRQSAL